MPQLPDLDHLASRVAERPEGRDFAPLAEARRKSGDLDGARAVLDQGIARHPRHLPAHLVMARVRVDANDLEGAERALREALRIDPSHPVVLEAMAELARRRGLHADARAWSEALDAALPGADDLVDDRDTEPAEAAADEPEELLTESLAALYERQGHLDRAHAAFAALADRSPQDTALAARRDALAAQIARSRPLPYDARRSGGLSLREALARIAAADGRTRPPADGYDAFFEADTAVEAAGSDFDAFQSWLKGLPR